jgi:hypothetical protein
MPAIQSSPVIGKNEDGSDITQDVDIFLTIPTAELVFSFAGLTLSDLRKSLLEGTLEAIMWAKWGSPSIPLGRGDLHITHPELCESDSIS